MQHQKSFRPGWKLLGTGLFATIALWGLVLPSLAAVEPAASPKDLKFPSLNKLVIPEPTRFELPNGLVVYLVEDHEVPLIDASAMIRTGSRWEPVEKAALASICGEVMRTGGTTTRKGDQLDEELDRLGAMVEIGIGQDSGSASVSVLKEDVDKGFSILADLLQNPAFPEDKIELAKISASDAIARRNDEPAGIAYREFDRILYGKDSAYGHQPELATVEAIKRGDLVAFHQQYFQPENVILGVWGDFKLADMRAKIETAFASWKRGGKPRPEVPPVEAGAAQRAGAYFVSKEDINQTWLLMGHLGGQRNDPDYYALSLMNRILGSGLSSRLFVKVRTEMGLTYNVRSAWNAGWDVPGAFLASGSTKTGTTFKMIEAMKAEIQRMTAEEVSDEELSRAKDTILKGFAFEFDSTGKIVERLMAYEYYGYPRDYLQRYRDNIEKVSQADVLRVAKKYLRPDQAIVLLLGREKDMDKPLSTLGNVTAIDISIPGAPGGNAPEK